MISKEMIEDMLAMQAKLDEVIIKGRAHSYRDLLRTRAYDRAILDELGELNHELKANWCWWKSSQKPVDRERVLEEFVDVLHFCLSYTLAEIATAQYPDLYRKTIVIICQRYLDKPDNNLDILDWWHYGQKKFGQPLIKVILLMHWLEFDLAEVYEAYKQKNAVNHQRQQEGY
ncbi:dUTP diphosphatase [Faecalibaculum rodentium]|uniref:dUTP diphosphatase n=1 Tax=Faecalibaculum rodentium TaxID=1702221 RepID=UPI00272C86F3|nr:dUTP diphosphatase [Faecalibaculum rodentium]